MDYINTSHPNFIGGSRAVEIAHQQVKHSRLLASVPKLKDGVNSDKLQASERSFKSRVLFARAGANEVMPYQGVRPTADSERSDPAGSMTGGRWGISSIFGSGKNRAPTKESSTKKSYSAPAHNTDHSFSMIQLREPPIILKPSECLTEQEAVEIAVTKLLLTSYYDIVRKNIEDLVPKALMHFLVNHTKRELHNVLIRKLYRENLFEDMLREPVDIAAKRKRIRETLHVLQEAYRTLEELPLDAEAAEKGFHLDTDPTGLPKIHGLPSSFYATSNDFSISCTASPKNPKSR